MLRNTIFAPDLFQVLLKNHFELSALANRLSASPCQVAMTLGHGGRSSTVSLNVNDDQQLRVAFSEGERTYELVMPLKPSAQALLNVTLTEDGKVTKHQFKPEAFVDAKMTEGFQGLHEKMLGHLKSFLPSNFFNKPQVTQDNVQEPPTGLAVSEAPSSQAPTETSTSADSIPAETTAPEYQTYLVRRDGERDLRFKGKLVARVSSLMVRGRYHVFTVFLTPSGKYVALKMGHSMWLGESDRVELKVADSKEELTAFFGYSNLAKALYQQLDISIEDVLE